MTLQLITGFLGELMQQFVAEPVVAARVVESDFKLRPRTVEEVGPVNVLLDQQRYAVGCETTTQRPVYTRSSATAEGPRDALC